MSRLDEARRDRDRLEFSILDGLEEVLQLFLEAVVDEAVAAPAIVAAGRRPDPFAYTNVRARWRGVISSVAENREVLSTPEVLELLNRSDLPDKAFQQATQIMEQAREEGWTAHRTKWNLTHAMIPRQGDATRNTYRSMIRTMARTGATRSFGNAQLQRLADEGYPEKLWVSLHDGRERDSHAEASGQVQPLIQPFNVGGENLMYPADPTASAEQTLNCRCFIVGGGIPEPAEPTEEGSIVAAASNKRPRWHGPIGVEKELTGDGRFFENEALTWGELPASFRIALQDSGAHDGAIACGTLDKIERREGGIIWGEGTFDLGSEAGREAHRLVEEEVMNWVSMDLDDVSFEIRVAQALIADPEVDIELEDTVKELPEPDADGRVKVMEINSDDEVMVFKSARIRGLTQVSIPAFAGARISLMDPVENDEEEEVLVAAAAPIRPPSAWFTDPGFTGPTPLRVTEEGRVMGHLATWGTCHISHIEACVTAPFSEADYAYFHLGSLVTLEGEEVGVGKITLGTGHANEKANARAALAHYDNTGSSVADIRVGEDEFGIWFSGALRPGVGEAKKRELLASPMSGDWRRIHGNLELIAALAVNVPGFPIPRPSGMVASGHQVSLVAAGMVPPSKVARPGTPGALSLDDLRWLKRLAAKERSEAGLQKAKVLNQRVKQLSAKAASLKKG